MTQKNTTLAHNSSIVLGPQYDLAPVAAASFRYAIFSQQRSGSTWLGARLANLGAFGVPEEYINKRYIRQLAERLQVPPDILGNGRGLNLSVYMKAVERVRTSSSGRFGIKIQPNQLFGMFKDDSTAVTRFLCRFNALIILTRRDKLAQAVSGAIAEATDRWRSDGLEPDLSGVNRGPLLRDIAVKLGRYILEAERMEAIVRATGRPTLQFCYEELVAEPHATLQSIVRFLGHDDTLASHAGFASVPVPAPAPGRVATELRAQFLDYIEGQIAPL